MRAVLALGLFLALATPARAATAEVDVGYECDPETPCDRYGGGWVWAIVNYVAAPGEENRLSVASNGQALILTDPGATINARALCVSIDAHTASCDAGKPQFSADMLTVQLGDRDDTATIAPGLVPPADLHAGAGDDVLTGGREDDALDPGRGTDRVDGGAGADTLNYAALHHAVTVDVAAGRSSEADSFTGIEAVRGGDRADHLAGGPAHDELFGAGGDDVLTGRGGDDLLSGELDADHLDGGPGDDTLKGDEPAADPLDVPRVRLSPDVLRGGAGNDTLIDPGGRNRMEGGTGDDLLSGGRDEDRLFGGSGSDFLLGRGGPDRLTGGSGKDRLRGGSGADWLFGGTGVDGLFGGSGSDRLAARDGRRERVECGPGRDRARADAGDHLHRCEIT
jgi:Ca2+-binding RTX toxin-like protein